MVIKRPDLAGFLLGVFAILPALPPVYWKYFGGSVDLASPAGVYLGFYMPGEEREDGYLSVIASMAYVQKQGADRPVTVFHELVDVEFDTGKKTRSYRFRWQHFVEGGDSFIRYDIDPKLIKVIDARPFLLKRQKTTHHWTWFVPRTELCRSPSCDTKKNFLIRPSETMFLRNLREVTFTFRARLVGWRPLSASCRATLDDTARRLLDGNAHKEQSRSGRPKSVVKIFVPCVPVSTNQLTSRRSRFPRTLGARRQDT